MLCCDCYIKINEFFYRSHFWAQMISQPCSTEDARTLYVKYVCKNHFLQSDFTTPERKRLNRGAVPCSSDSALQEPTPQLPDFALTDLNSLPSLLSPQKNLHVQPSPSRTYAATNVSFIKHCTSKKARGVSSVQCNCAIDVFDSSTHQS